MSGLFLLGRFEIGWIARIPDGDWCRAGRRTEIRDFIAGGKLSPSPWEREPWSTEGGQRVAASPETFCMRPDLDGPSVEIVGIPGTPIRSELSGVLQRLAHEGCWAPNGPGDSRRIPTHVSAAPWSLRSRAGENIPKSHGPLCGR